jgi:hypothetical protein
MAFFTSPPKRECVIGERPKKDYPARRTSLPFLSPRPFKLKAIRSALAVQLAIVLVTSSTGQAFYSREPSNELLVERSQKTLLWCDCLIGCFLPGFANSSKLHQYNSSKYLKELWFLLSKEWPSHTFT